MFYELREYRVKPGMRAHWVRLMEEEILPFQISKGVTVVGSFIAEDERDLSVWIRRFEDEGERERLYREVYDSEHWKNVIKPHYDEILDLESVKTSRLEDLSSVAGN